MKKSRDVINGTDALLSSHCLRWYYESPTKWCKRKWGAWSIVVYSSHSLPSPFLHSEYQIDFTLSTNHRTTSQQPLMESIFIHGSMPAGLSNRSPRQRFEFDSKCPWHVVKRWSRIEFYVWVSSLPENPTYNKRHGKVLFSSLSPLKLQGLERWFLDMK